MDLQKWMTRFQLTGNRLIESWMDLLPDLEATSPEACAHVARRRQEHEARQAELNAERRTQQRLAFPLGDNLSALIFVSLADLTQDRRNILTSITTHRGRTLDQYNVQELRDLFLEMFCATRTAGIPTIAAEVRRVRRDKIRRKKR